MAVTACAIDAIAAIPVGSSWETRAGSVLQRLVLTAKQFAFRFRVVVSCIHFAAALAGCAMTFTHISKEGTSLLLLRGFGSSGRTCQTGFCLLLRRK